MVIFENLTESFMFWTFKDRDTYYASWGACRQRENKNITDEKPRFDIPIYNGSPMKSGDSAVFLMQGDATLGMGDCIWLINYLRDVYSVKGNRRIDMNICSSPSINEFMRKFFPPSFNMINEYMTLDSFAEMNHFLPSMYFWKEENGIADKSWTDNRSILERLYNWVGIKYQGLLDWGDFTPEDILHPSKTFYSKLGINPKDKFIFFQWHSSGHSKNLPPASNIKIIKHLIKKYGYKVYVVGRLKSLDMLNGIKGVVNLSGKTEGFAEYIFSLAINSEFIICPDSAGVHLSEAYKVPCACIMSTLPPVYIASKYKIPSFMYGSGECGYKPCGVVHQLPLHKCPKGTKNYCHVLTDIDLGLLDSTIEKSISNRERYRNAVAGNFYSANLAPISLHYE